MQIQSYSFRLGSEILDTANFIALKNEIINIFTNIQVPQLNPPKVRTRDGQTFTFATNQSALNVALDTEFVTNNGWINKPFIDNQNPKRTNIRSDYGKGRVLVEVQFGNMSRWYADIFKFQVAYSLGTIDVGVSIVPTQAFAQTMDENVSYFERARRELELARLSVAMPLWLVGIAP